MKQFTLFIFAAIMLLSCSKKKDNDTTTPNATATDTTRIDAAKLTASPWHGIGIYNLYYDFNGNHAQRGGDGFSRTYNLQYGIAWVDSLEAKFTFNADNTYEHKRLDNGADSDCYIYLVPSHGAWQLADDNKTLRISFVQAPGGMLTCHVVSFRDNYMHVTYTDTTGTGPDVFHMEFER